MVFNKVKTGRGESGALEGIIKRNFIVSNIPENLVLNQVQWHRVIHVAVLT
uniref:Uncharacterized protein n=1 Tax=Cajanus cajan TaxID=3821 RepID=A0A151SJB6_CAJCA|nr:hypothetical protein KK1_001021 [Cajanus cajan]